MRQNLQSTNVFGVEYLHGQFPNEDDLYLTVFGLPFLDHLLPENLFLDDDWMQSHSLRLNGSSTLYRVTTRPLNGRALDIVIKWNRMGQHIPPQVSEEPVDFEFNSPFEEFSLVMELRNARDHASGTVYTHRPLAIYVPHVRRDPALLGRRNSRMLRLIEAHTEIELNMFRSYAVVYEWVKGVDAVQALELGLLDESTMAALTLEAEQRVLGKGFVVHDRKPHHLIVRPKPDGTLARARDGGFLYALIDFELLKRTPQREKTIRDSRVSVYLRKQAERFEARRMVTPPHLTPITLFDVDYIHGDVPSTQGKLWVAGRDPDLFDFFLPERWEVTPRVKLRSMSEVYHTVSKDEVHLVWKVSRAGSKPDMDPFDERQRRILDFGYNSPFEEFSLARYLFRREVPTISPLAVYMAGNKIEMADFLLDESRYTSHEGLLNPDGSPVLRRDRAYMTLWQDWSHPEQGPDGGGPDRLRSMSALHAYRKNLIGAEQYFRLLETLRQRLMMVGVEDLNLTGAHFLIAFDGEGSLVRDQAGRPALRICDFELLRYFRFFDGPDPRDTRTRHETGV